MRADINISTTDQSGNKQTNKLSYVNPNATEQQYATLIDKVVGMSNNILVSAAKVETSDINLNASSLQDPEMYWPTGTGEKKKTISVSLTTIMQDTTHDTQGSEPDKCGAHTQEIGYARSSKQRPYIKSNGTMIPAAIGANVSPSDPRPTWVLYLSAGWNYDYKLEGDTFEPPLYGDIVIAIDPDDTYAGAEITLTITEG